MHAMDIVYKFTNSITKTYFYMILKGINIGRFSVNALEYSLTWFTWTHLHVYTYLLNYKRLFSEAQNGYLFI